MSNNKQIAHLWANQSRESGRGSHFYFDGATIYSYGQHFPIARHYKGAVLFTSKGYSSSTARHKSYVLQACNHLPVFTVEEVRCKPCAKDVKQYKARIAALVKTASKARNVSGHLAGIDALIDEGNRFCAHFGFKTRFAQPENWEELKEKARGDAIREREAKARKQAKFDAYCAETVKLWLAGDAVSIPYGYGKVLLRVRLFQAIGEERLELETSRGATVPLESARLAFRFCQSKRESGWHRNGETFQVGDFQIDSVSNLGIIAGCHRLDWQEVERFAKAQGWV